MVKIKVVTRLIDSDEPPQVAVIDHDNVACNRWLAKHCWWAMRTGRSVTTFPTDDPLTWKDSRDG